MFFRGCFMASEVSTRGAMVARWFGVDPGDDPYPGSDGADATQTLELRAGQIILITGPSGAGKSALLRELRARRRDVRWVDLSRMRLADRAVVDCVTECLPRRGFVDEEARIVAALELLSRVGLGEVWTYLRRAGELSEGQRWRLRVCVGLAREMWGNGKKSAPQAEPLNGARGRRLTVLAADEFCAVLDRVSAMVVARGLRRVVEGAMEVGRRVCAVVATSHEDLARALGADVVVGCDFGRVRVVRAGEPRD